MRKTGMVPVIALLICFAIGPLANAEMAKEGSASDTRYFTGTSNVLAQGETYLQINYDGRGINISDNEASPLHRASVHCVGSIQAVKGATKEFGLCTYTRPDGDKIYETYQGAGELGKGTKGTCTYVGGTGKCEGMTGKAEYQITPLKGPAKGTWATVVNSKASWKIP